MLSFRFPANNCSSLTGATTLTLALLASVAGPNPAFAQADIRMTFAELDANDDGMIAADEYEHYHSMASADLPAGCDEGMWQEVLYVDFASGGSFDELDTDGDRSVTFDELRHAYVLNRIQEFMELDTDRNGRVSRDEHKHALDVYMQATEELLSAGCAAALTCCSEQSPCEVPKGRAQADPIEAKPGHEATGKPKRGMSGMGGENPDAAYRIFFGAIDADRDGQLSYDEYINR